MNFPQFWAKEEAEAQPPKGGRVLLACWRWSESNLAEAQAAAKEAIAHLVSRVTSQGLPPKHGYSYADRPLREEILHRFGSEDQPGYALVTRNAWGCEVMNAARLLFVDVDFEEPPKPGVFGRLFGKASPAAPDPLESALQKTELWAKSDPAWGWRAYRTRGGLRLIATHDFFEPDSPTARDAFEALGADPLYRKL
ncbi:MAG: hypothetical protein JO317_07075, partial [Verrucomicrobiae bacterium]|nr:hypothetical protein [Verrucomicrobiae bacterium]